MFNDVIRWDLGYDEKDFETLFSVAKRLEENVEDKTISKGFIYSLLRMWRTTFPDLDDLSVEKQIKARLERKRYMPHLKYQLARNIKDKGKRESLQKSKGFLICQKSKIFEHIEKDVKSCMPWIRIPASWVSLRER